MTDPGHDDDSQGVGTTLDPELARPRLKEGLIPSDTGVFLRMERGARPGEVVTLSAGGSYLIGRHGADIALDDPKISRKHAEVSVLGPDAYIVRDLASTNGTFVNGRRVTEKILLSNGDRIRVGDTVFGFYVVEGAIAAVTR